VEKISIIDNVLIVFAISGAYE